MASHAPKRMTLAEFLAWDDGSDRRYQLLDGVLTMMAPATEAHGEIALSLGAAGRAVEDRDRVAVVGDVEREILAHDAEPDQADIRFRSL